MIISTYALKYKCYYQWSSLLEGSHRLFSHKWVLLISSCSLITSNESVCCTLHYCLCSTCCSVITSTRQTSASRFLLSFTINCTHSLKGSLFNGLTGGGQWTPWAVRNAFTCSDDNCHLIGVRKLSNWTFCLQRRLLLSFMSGGLLLPGQQNIGKI